MKQEIKLVRFFEEQRSPTQANNYIIEQVAVLLCLDIFIDWQLQDSQKHLFSPHLVKLVLSNDKFTWSIPNSTAMAKLSRQKTL